MANPRIHTKEVLLLGLTELIGHEPNHREYQELLNYLNAADWVSYVASFYQEHQDWYASAFQSRVEVYMSNDIAWLLLVESKQDAALLRLKHAE